jgi:cyclopropane-fatty-acyl-phospholipid synthase
MTTSLQRRPKDVHRHSVLGAEHRARDAFAALKRQAFSTVGRVRPRWIVPGERYFIAKLQKHWRGPAICIRLAHRTFVLGEGQPTAELVLKEPFLLLKLWLSPMNEFGEAYMRGDIEINGSLTSFLEAVYLSRPEDLSPWFCRFATWVRHLPKYISRQRAAANARHHYNIGTEFFRRWLDPSLTYSCAYYLNDSDDLATAQQQKLELLCQKARLEPGQTLLDIGCGWGSLLIHAARHHGVYATGITPADDQANYIEALVKREGLSNRIRVLRAGWRDIEGTFDRIISVGMFEHVGLKQYREFFKCWRNRLAAGGLSLLHCIGRTKPVVIDPWTDKYIFPGGYLATLAQIANFSASAGLCILDVENLREHYVRTLDQWRANFLAAEPDIEANRGSEFARMWSLYLHGSYAGFRWGDLQLWQTVLAKDNHHPWPLDRQVDLGQPAALSCDQH